MNTENAGPRTIPTPDPETGLLALKAMLRERHPLAALQVFHARLGDVFQINLPGFKPVMLVGPEAAHFALVEGRGDLRWRNESDPVTHLLRHGVLVEDGQAHDELRRAMNPALHRKMLAGYLVKMQAAVERVTGEWRDGQVVDMLVEMRKIALLILMDALYQVDFYPQLKGYGSNPPLWNAILGSIRYISPGIWMLAPKLGRLQMPWSRSKAAIRQMDEYLYQIIAERRKILKQEGGADGSQSAPDDLLGLLIHSGMEDGLIRDQLLTMLIAGHDTVTALMAWSFYLLGEHPDVMERARLEAVELLRSGLVPPIDEVAGLTLVNQMETIGRVIREALRLYPPIHLGSRVSARELEFQGYRIPAGIRVVYSIYLTQRHPAYWEEPDRFNPDRYANEQQPAPYAWLAFGGGPRNCIGAAFGQLEARLVIASVLGRFRLDPVGGAVHPYMGATLEPHPGVRMRVTRF